MIAPAKKKDYRPPLPGGQSYCWTLKKGASIFITNADQNISWVGGSLRDVQALARHSSLNMTQRYIELDSEAQRRVLKFV